MQEKEIRAGYQRLTKKLIQKKLTITSMESCTAGQIASLITDTEGSSAILKGAFVTYSNEAKVKNGVPAETIRKYGVYSQETALAMAKACRSFYEADLGIGITGTMGNVDPANGDSHPGIVYLALEREEGAMAWQIFIEEAEDRLQYKLQVAGNLLEFLEPILEAM